MTLSKIYDKFKSVFGDNPKLFFELDDIFERDNRLFLKFIEKKRFEKACKKAKSAGDMARLLNP